MEFDLGETISQCDHPNIKKIPENEQNKMEYELQAFKKQER